MYKNSLNNKNHFVFEKFFAYFCRLKKAWKIYMFTTKVEIPESPVKIAYEDSIMTLGSCFSENIGKKLQDVYFNSDINPFGVLYNPVSVKNSLYFLLHGKRFTENDLFFDGDLWHSFMHSSVFSDVSAEGCLQKINSQLEKSKVFLQQTKFLFITFGTAYVYEHVKDGKIVSNCHKLPAKEFARYRLSIDDIVSDYNELLTELNSQIPGLHIIFTVSPIRHWKDGAHENNISKAILLQAVDVLQKRFENNISYFPAYEIQLDELRDYRYYAGDMLHPSETAIDYIWTRFSDCFFSAETNKIKKELELLNADFAHRPLHPQSESYKKFQKSTEKKKEILTEQYPFLAERFELLNR